MSAVAIDGRCTACGLCIITCPEGALAPAPKRPTTTGAPCTACLACIEVCPVGAITVSA
jgi:NAD-dependent dihydropyrimidine dehydrogenase PreA subunit